MSSGAQQSRLKVHVPLSFVVRSGRKAIVIESPTQPPVPNSVNEPLVKALAKAYRWRRLIEEGSFSSITELAKAQHLNQSYACRILRLTLLASILIEDALNARLPKHIGLKEFVKPVPWLWNEQTKIFRKPTQVT